MSDEESEGLPVGRAWLKARLAASRVGFCSFPTDPGKLLDPVQNHLEGQGRGPGRGEKFSCPGKEPFALRSHTSSCLRAPSLEHWL